MILSSGGAVLELLRNDCPPDGLQRISARMKTAWAEGGLEIAFSDWTRGRWQHSIRKLISAGAGSAVLSTDDGELELTLAMSKREELMITARLQSPPEFLHEMRLVLELAQTDLVQLEAFLGDY